MNTKNQTATAKLSKDAYIGLGANLGDRLEALQGAVAALRSTEQVNVTGASSLYETAPIGGPDGQDFYLNAAVKLETSLEPHALLDCLQRIETEFKRVRTVRWGPRTLDLDLLLYGAETIETERLTVPHPRLAERRFVLAPLADIAPEVKVPSLEISVSDLLKAAKVDEGDIRRISEGWA